MTDIIRSSADQLFIDAGNRIVKFREELENNLGHKPPSGELFHYTSVDGLRGIIQNNELWASSAYFLNDSAEITYGYGVLKDALENWISRYESDDSCVAIAIARDLLGFFGGALLNKDIVKPIYSVLL